MVGYSGIDLEKKIILIGSGFGNYELSGSTTSILGTMRFKVNSNGSSIEGFSGRFYVEVFSNDIVIRKNFIKNLVIFSDVTGAIIIQNNFAKYGGEGGISIYMEKNTTAMILNNKFHNWGNIGIFAGNSNTSVIIQNNIMDITAESAINVINSDHLIRNNIFTNVSICAGAINSVCTHNMSSKPGLPLNDTNLESIDLNTVFANFSGWTDLHLKENSPAKGTGYNGVDMGIYGGEFPFVDGGYPSIPSIYFLDVPLVGNQKDGINVTIKAKSNQ